MKLDQQSINSFKQSYHKEYGIMLDDGEAAEQAHRFYAFMDAVYGEERNFYNEIPVKPIFNNLQ